MKVRTLWVDYVKAIGIILVVYGHVAGGVFASGMIEDVKLFWLVDSIVYSFHMPLFFCLSGLFFRQSLDRRGAKNVLFNKLDTIIYPYIVWSLLQGFTEVYLSSYTNGNTTSSEVLSLLWHPRAQFWFLYALLVVFVFAVLVFSKISSKYTLVIFLGAAALYVFQGYLSKDYHLTYLSGNFVFFVFGMLMNKLLSRGLLLPRTFLLLSFVSFVFAQYVFHFSCGFTYHNKGLFSLCVALLSIMFIIVLSMILAQRSFKWLMKIGESSMEIYLMHMLVIGGCRLVLVKVFNIRSVSLHVFIGCAMCVLLPVVTTVLVRRYKVPFVFSMPMSKWMNSVLQRCFRSKIL